MDTHLLKFWSSSATSRPCRESISAPGCAPEWQEWCAARCVGGAPCGLCSWGPSRLALFEPSVLLSNPNFFPARF